MLNHENLDLLHKVLMVNLKCIRIILNIYDKTRQVNMRAYDWNSFVLNN